VIDEQDRKADSNPLPEAMDDTPRPAPQAEGAPASYERPSPATAHAQEPVPADALAIPRSEPPFDLAQGGPEALEGPHPFGPLPAPPPAPEPLAMDPASDGARMVAVPADGPRPFQEAMEQPEARLTSPGLRLAQVKEELVAWVKTLVSAAVYAVLIVTFGFQVARVEGQSMAPTLEDQDRLIVNKLVYRIGEPRRGDIVMLYYPLNPDKSFVKRVIAEEGDTVRIVDGRVYVNDIPLKDDYVSSEYRSHDDWGPQVIPEGYYFVMGDHRNNSSDSRHWGMVPKRYIIGKVQLRWWPVPTARVF
jgi:signal peptidase I